MTDVCVCVCVQLDYLHPCIFSHIICCFKRVCVCGVSAHSHPNACGCVLPWGRGGVIAASACGNVNSTNIAEWRRTSSLLMRREREGEDERGCI